MGISEDVVGETVHTIIPVSKTLILHLHKRPPPEITRMFNLTLLYTETGKRLSTTYQD